MCDLPESMDRRHIRSTTLEEMPNGKKDAQTQKRPQVQEETQKEAQEGKVAPGVEIPDWVHIQTKKER